MEFELNNAILILARTPEVLENLLEGLPATWTHNNEGPDTWSPFDVIGHLIHGENTDWIVRAEIILGDGSNKEFEPYDRFAQFELSAGKSLDALLAEFKTLRKNNLEKLKSMEISSQHLDLTGFHPELGEVTLRQLLSAWVVHDLGHIAQVARVMAKQYSEEVGPWHKYLTILNHTPKE